MDTLQARIVQLEQENAALRALLKSTGLRIRRRLKIKYPRLPIRAAVCFKTRSHRRWSRFSIPISEAAKMYTASAAAQRTEKRVIFRSVRILGSQTLPENDRAENCLQGLPEPGL